MKEEYVIEISKFLETCNDINTLDLVLQILVKKCQNA